MATEPTCASPNRKLAPCVLPPHHPEDHANEAGETWFNHGQVQRYEITWTSGHVETVVAHQVTYPHAGLAMLGFGALASDLRAEGGPPRVKFHAEINGQWVLTLSAREEDLRTVRLVTDGEAIPGGTR